jgi:uncharacterized protein (DUF2461 family)
MRSSVGQRTLATGAHNEQRTAEQHRGDAARAPFHYARESRFARERAPAELRR